MDISFTDLARELTIQRGERVFSRFERQRSYQRKKARKSLKQSRRHGIERLRIKE